MNFIVMLSMSIANAGLALINDGAGDDDEEEWDEEEEVKERKGRGEEPGEFHCEVSVPLSICCHSVGTLR